MSYKGQYFLLALLLLLAACAGTGGSAGLEAQRSGPVHDFDGSARAGAFSAVAVDENDRANWPLTASLRLSVNELGDVTRVTIAAVDAAPRAAAYVHLAYNPLRLMPIATRSGEIPTVQTLFLGVTSQPGTVALGMVTAGLEQSLVGDFVIGEVDFVPGRQTLRSSSALNKFNAGVADLTLIGAELDTLQWHYLNRGDYDQNGLVNISDLTPIGQYFEQSVPLLGEFGDKSAAPYPADGNEDKLVTIHDITPIGANFLNRLEEYVIKSAAAESGPFTALGQVVPLSAGERPTGQFRFTAELSNPQAQTYYAVFPAGGGVEGPQSNAVFYDPAPPQLNPPTNVQVAENAGQLTVSWQAPLTGSVPTGYNLYSADASEAFGLGTATLHESSPIAGLSINLAAVDFPPGLDHYFALKSVEDEVESADFSNIAFWEGDEPPAGCPAPLNFIAGNNGTHIVLEWDPPADATSVVDYIVYWCNANPAMQGTICSPLGITAETNFVVTDTETAPPDQMHWFSLQAHCVDSEFSEDVHEQYFP